MCPLTANELTSHKSNIVPWNDNSYNIILVFSLLPVLNAQGYRVPLMHARPKP